MILNNLSNDKSFPIVGIVGTAKNTGKTTTLSFLMQNAFRRGFYVGITGIGYDGEEIDNITMLPKPRLYLEKNTIVTTSEKCLEVTSTEFTLLEKTDIKTALGRVCIVQITKPGLMVIAGPNKKSDLVNIIEILIKYKISMLFVDGSLNRISPMSVVDKIIFTTGASRNTEIKILVQEMKGIQTIFHQPKTEYELSFYNKITFIEDEMRESALLSMVVNENAESVVSQITNKTKAIYIPGLVSTGALYNFASCLKDYSEKIELIIHSPISLILSGEPSNTGNVIRALQKKNIQLKYFRSPELTAVTINPFYPKESSSNFTAAFIDKFSFKDEMIKALTVPVYNIKEDEDNLLDLCLS